MTKNARTREVEVMGRVTKGRYGFTGDEVHALYESWRRFGLKDESAWDCFDDFVLWCSRAGWCKSCHLRKVDERKPHGPKNSFWDPPDTAGSIYVPGHPCRECKKEPHCTAICDKRAAYWDERMEPLRRVIGVDGV